MGTSRLRVMALDDDEGDIELLRRNLEMLPQYDIELAALSRPGELLERIQAEEVDVILLDYMLGRATGLDVLRQLRAAGNLTPVVMLTGQGDEHLAVELMRAGATDYLSKARLSPESLGQALRNALRIGRLERQAVLAEEKLRLAAKVFDNALEGVAVTDADANILSVNPAFTAVTGYTEAEVLGKNPRMLGSGFHNREFYRNLWDELLTVGQWKGEIWNTAKSGNTFLMWQTISAVKNDKGRITHYVSVFFDITERKKHEENVRHQAYHDALTGLPNRRLFHDRLTMALLQARREREMLAVMFLDLDHFKEINDKFGHQFGDAYLNKMASALREIIREDVDFAFRFGGDEFAVVIFADYPHACSKARQALVMMENKVSIGITSINRSTPDDLMLEEFIHRADNALYEAKHRGRGQSVVDVCKLSQNGNCQFPCPENERNEVLSLQQMES